MGYYDMLTMSGLLGQLKKVEWSGISRYTLMSLRGGVELLEEAKGRGVEVVFGVEGLSRHGLAA